MSIAFYQQLNIISSIILVLFLLYAYNVLDVRSKINKAYIFLLYVNLALIFLQTILNLFNSDSSAFYFINGIKSILIPAMPFTFLIFIGYYFSKSSVLSKALKKTSFTLLILNTIMVVFSLKWPDNLLLKAFPILITCFYMALSIHYIISKRKIILRIEYYYILTIAAVYFVLEALRVTIKDNQYIWDCSAIILIFMFIVLQQRELYRDTLTGAKNRLALQKCLSTYTGKNSEGFTIIMIDLDYFKNINDSYGHAEGDYILRLFVKLLQRVFLNRGMVVRLGGDEFAVLIDIIDENEIRTLVSNMERTFEKFNDKGLKPYHIKFSYACGIYKDKNISIDDFINSIDLNMYKSKKSKKGNSKVRRIDL